MEIRRVAFQHGPNETQTFREAYKEHWVDERVIGDVWYKIGVRMVDLLTLLETINGPAMWACTSHADVVLFDKDYQLHSTSVSRVSISTLDAFEVSVAVSADFSPWQRVVGRTRDVAEAAQMVLAAVTQTLTFSTQPPEV